MASRFDLKLGPDLDVVMTEMARDQGISKAEAVRRALVGYASLRRIVNARAGRTLVLRDEDSWEEQRVVIL